MKSKLKIIFLFLLFSFNSFAQQSEQDKKMAWWREARFGMFIHWGPYAVWGGDFSAPFGCYGSAFSERIEDVHFIKRIHEIIGTPNLSFCIKRNRVARRSLVILIYRFTARGIFRIVGIMQKHIFRFRTASYS